MDPNNNVHLCRVTKKDFRDTKCKSKLKKCLYINIEKAWNVLHILIMTNGVSIK